MTKATWWLPEQRRAYGSVLAGFLATIPLWIRVTGDFAQSTYVGYMLVLLAA